MPDSGLIKYGDAPVYNSQDPQEEYYYRDRYQGAYNPADARTAAAGAADASDSKAGKQKKLEEKERAQRAHSSGTSESDNGTRRRHGRKEENSGVADKGTRTYKRRPSPGNAHTDDEEGEENKPIQSPAELAVLYSQRAFAESVPDNGNEKEDVAEEVKRS